MLLVSEPQHWSVLESVSGGVLLGGSIGWMKVSQELSGHYEGGRGYIIGWMVDGEGESVWMVCAMSCSVSENVLECEGQQSTHVSLGTPEHGSGIPLSLSLILPPSLSLSFSLPLSRLFWTMNMFPTTSERMTQWVGPACRMTPPSLPPRRPSLR